MERRHLTIIKKKRRMAGKDEYKIINPTFHYIRTMENQTKLSDHRLRGCLSSQTEGRTFSTQIRIKPGNSMPRACWRGGTYMWVKSWLGTSREKMFIEGYEKHFKLQQICLRKSQTILPGDIKHSCLLH